MWNVVVEVIGQVLASDADDAPDSSSVVYSLDADSSTWFSVNSLTGQISSTVSFDREFVDRLNFVVVATSRSRTSKVQLTTHSSRVCISTLVNGLSLFTREVF